MLMPVNVMKLYLFMTVMLYLNGVCRAYASVVKMHGLKWANSHRRLQLPFYATIHSDNQSGTDDWIEYNNWTKWEFGDISYEFEKSDMPTTRYRRRKLDEMWPTLSDEQVQQGINALLPFCSEKRQQRMESILSQRIPNIRMVFENPSNANNMWAALRTFDCFGIQFIDIIVDDDQYSREWRKGVIFSALGSQKWLTLNQHASSIDCVHYLKQRGYTILATDLSETSVSIHDIDWQPYSSNGQPHEADSNNNQSHDEETKFAQMESMTATIQSPEVPTEADVEKRKIRALNREQSNKEAPATTTAASTPSTTATPSGESTQHQQQQPNPTSLESGSQIQTPIPRDPQQTANYPPPVPGMYAIVFGNEERGISPDMRGLADQTFYIPMRGFAESLNLSAAAATVCATLQAKRDGLMTGNALPEDVKARIFLTWLSKSVKSGLQILRRAKLPIPATLTSNNLGYMSLGDEALEAIPPPADVVPPPPSA